MHCGGLKQIVVDHVPALSVKTCTLARHIDMMWIEVQQIDIEKVVTGSLRNIPNVDACLQLHLHDDDCHLWDKC
jgi:hypothetical protein